MPYLKQIDITGFDGSAGGGLRVQFRLLFVDPTYKLNDAPMKILLLQAVDHAAWKIGSPFYNLKIASDSIQINGNNMASLLPFQSTLPFETIRPFQSTLPFQTILPFQSTLPQAQSGDTSSLSSTTTRVTIAPNSQCSKGKIKYCEDMPYDYVRYPNRFGHQNSVEAEAALALFQVRRNRFNNKMILKLA